MSLTSLAFFSTLLWLDGSPLLDHIEPYRRRLFTQALDSFDPDGRPRYNLIVDGRAKKNWKTCDEVLAALYCCLTGDAAGRDAECYLIANDADRAREDLALAKRLVRANAALEQWLTIRTDVLERKDGLGFIRILPAQDVVGQHGKSYRFCGYDEIHGYRNWDIFEALQPDPTRLDAQQWITSYASIYHRPGVPLFDLFKAGRGSGDPRMLFSWYAADYTTDPDFADATLEDRANPSRGSWSDPSYLEQQQRRLPAHKYRRLHLNLPGLPEGSAFQPEPVMDAVERGMVKRAPELGLTYRAFVDMSGGSSDDAVLAIGHRDPDGRCVLDCIVNQGQPPPFDPRKAIERFTTVLAEYDVYEVHGTVSPVRPSASISEAATEASPTMSPRRRRRSCMRRSSRF